MVACAYGGRVKNSVQTDTLWVTASDLCASISWAANWMQPVCDMLLPRLATLADVCAAPPPDPVAPDLGALAISGELYKLPNIVADWIWASWKATNWNSLCECDTSDCGPIYTGHFDHTFPASTPNASSVLLTIPVHAGATGLRRTYRDRTIGGPGSVNVRFTAYNAAGVQVGQSSDAVNMSQTLPRIQNSALFAGATEYRFELTRGSTASYSVHLEYTFEFTCATLPPAPTPYVPPDEEPQPTDVPPLPPGPVGCTTDDLCNMISLLNSRLALVSRDVTLIQRQAVPFAYLNGASHSVSGTGQFAVQGILGLSVNVSGGSTIPKSPGTPEAAFQYGWISFGTAEGWIRRTPIRHDPTLMLDVSGAITKVGYSLNSGVSAVITELVREP